MKKSPSGLPDKIENDKKVLSLLHVDKASDITFVYELYWEEFIRFAMKNFSVSPDEVVDVYQESFLALYRNVSQGKLTALSSSLKTYMFQIGKHQLLKLCRQKKGEPLTENVELSGDFPEDTGDPDWMRKQEIANRVIAGLEEPCHTVLTLYYWHRKSMKEIADALQYKNDQVAKNKKGSCLKKLKIVLLEHFRKEGLV
ncbi:MAG: sigma-70 family RNA polymerase sigma factor [Bacteroides sp.]|nr:sigma-70 family RNA polymerase sigma factor [Bacteroides sp.]